VTWRMMGMSRRDPSLHVLSACNAEATRTAHGGALTPQTARILSLPHETRGSRY